MIPLEDLFETYTDAAQVNEATAKPTVATGTYIFQGTKAEGKKNPEDAKMYPNRVLANIFGRLSNRETGKKLVSIGFDASWEPMKDARGYMDTPSKLWGQLVVSLDLVKAPVAEVLEAVKLYPVSMFVEQVFEHPDKQNAPKDLRWRTARSEEEADTYRNDGRTPRNFVKSIQRAP